MSGSNVKKLHQTNVTYRGHAIKLTHRPDTNDWKYSITYHLPMILSNYEPRYDTALRKAKQEIDAIEGDCNAKQ